MKTKITFELNLDDIDDQHFLARVLKSSDMASVLFELMHNIRGKTHSKSGPEVIDYIQEMIQAANLDRTEEYIR